MLRGFVQMLNVTNFTSTTHPCGSVVVRVSSKAFSCRSGACRRLLVGWGVVDRVDLEGSRRHACSLCDKTVDAHIVDVHNKGPFLCAL